MDGTSEAQDRCSLPEETTSQPSRPHPAFRCWHTRIWSGTTSASAPRRRFYWCRNISAKSIEGVTRQVNGPALAGLDDRRRRYEAAQRALA